MARTFRKRIEKCWVDDKFATLFADFYQQYYGKNNNKWKAQERARFRTRSLKRTIITSNNGFPKSYRKYANNKRKAFDKAALHKELTCIDYDAVYDPWNCKTADPDWYD